MNNFDQCIGGANNVQHGDFDKLVKLDPELKGILQNVNYQFEPEGTEPDNWTSHTVENSGAEKYSSSLGKFISSNSYVGFKESHSQVDLCHNKMHS